MSRRRRSAVAICVIATGCVPIVRAAEMPVSGTLDLDTQADLSIFGAARDSQSGWAVAPAGDVNADGIRDVILGAPKASPSPDRKKAGAAYVVFGRRSGSPVDLADLGSDGFRIEGARAGDEAGVAVAGAGDVNGDGLADLLVGAPRADDREGKSPGAAYVVFGKRETTPTELANLGSGGYRISGATAGDMAGTSLAAVPDVNGDGAPEVIVGAPQADVAERPHAGAAFVVLGRRSGGDVDLATLGDGGFRLDGPPESYAGLAVGSVGDMNGDGLSELLVGAPALKRTPADDTKPPSLGGSAFIVFGRATTGAVDLANLGDAGIEIAGRAGEGLGVSVAGVGDMNGDKLPDVAVGGPLAGSDHRRSGSAFVFYGRPSPGTIDSEPLGDGGFRIDGAEPNDAAGSVVDSAGDFNGDGLEDVVVTAPFASPLSRREAGAAYVVFGTGHNENLDLAALGSAGVRVAGPSAGDWLRSAAGVGDVNGDGTPDVLAGTLFGRGPKVDRLGAAFLVSGFKPKPKPEPPPPDPGAAEEVALDNCHAAGSVAMILDDSGSMLASDPETLRSQAVDLLISKPRNEGKVLSGIQFGDAAEELFPSQAIEPPGSTSNQDAIRDVLDEQLAADNGGTNLAAPFELAQKAKPRADAWVLLTDGGHTAGPYDDPHKGGPPTYVIGLGVGRKSADGKRLERIAALTGGRYFSNVKPERLQAALNVVDSRLNCDTALETYVDTLEEPGTAPPNEDEIKDGTNSAEVNVSWDDPNDEMEPGTIEYLDEQGNVDARLPARTLAAATRSSKTRTVSGLTVRGHRGTTYFSLRIGGVRKSTMRVRIRAKTIYGKRVRVRTQVSQSRRRN